MLTLLGELITLGALGVLLAGAAAKAVEAKKSGFGLKQRKDGGVDAAFLD